MADKDLPDSLCDTLPNGIPAIPGRLRKARRLRRADAALLVVVGLAASVELLGVAANHPPGLTAHGPVAAPEVRGPHAVFVARRPTDRPPDQAVVSADSAPAQRSNVAAAGPAPTAATPAGTPASSRPAPRPTATGTAPTPTPTDTGTTPPTPSPTPTNTGTASPTPTPTDTGTTPTPSPA